ncbi:hypothetical protein POVWA1_009120 [Plasmodium ovale wallikeri]|uniref:Uncharacterized protein n=1 Tax=Plasmodium ovale wallikeri TaxID=864142 RepID=A0A1A8YJW9_PLAOA|nr:hypothetical protein POVWA1_009120 [Plasmodium ovale wallikeri]
MLLSAVFQFVTRNGTCTWQDKGGEALGISPTLFVSYIFLTALRVAPDLVHPPSSNRDHYTFEKVGSTT